LAPDGDGPPAAESALPADTVVIATGAWTPALLPWLDGVLTTVAQPVLHFGPSDATMYRGPHFPPFAADIAGSGWYGFPALPDGRVKIGHHSTGRQVSPDDRGEVSLEHVALARSFLADSIPTLAGAPIVGDRVCLYCDTFDGDLFIDRDPHREGLVVAAGGNGHAFKFAPLLGAIVADVVENQENPWQTRFRWRSDGERRIEAGRHMSTD
jgi:glycine/D-amino acid oxidase-like deaminating enzyme